MLKVPIIAPLGVLAQYGGEKSEDNCALTYKNWNIRCNHGIIADEAQLVSLGRRISTAMQVPLRSDDTIVLSEDTILHLPPMIFPQNTITLSTGPISIAIDPQDAVTCWALKHKQSVRVPLVPYAEGWNNNSPTTRILKQQQWDWTYNSNYTVTMNSYDEHVVYAGSDIVSSSANCSAGWEACSSGGINMDLLKARDEILLYDDILLYQDDLQDCGEAKCDAKIRVMPSCFFILMRMYVRVDGSEVSMQETRIFHEFGSEFVYKEVTNRDATLAQLNAIAGKALRDIELRDVNFIATLLPAEPAPLAEDGTVLVTKSNYRYKMV